MNNCYHYPSRHFQGRPMKNFDEFFDDYFNFPEKYSDQKYFTFNVDITEHHDHYEIEAELVGLNKEEICIEAKHGQIILSAKRKNINKADEINYIQQERNFGHFQRVFYLNDLDEENITAEYMNGLLKIHAKKASVRKNKTNKIPIT
jgi:HSP20 family protein